MLIEQEIEKRAENISRVIDQFLPKEEGFQKNLDYTYLCSSKDERYELFNIYERS